MKNKLFFLLGISSCLIFFHFTFVNSVNAECTTPCSNEDYPEPCTISGQSGTKQCHKRNSCRTTDGQCSWGNDSRCDECVPNGAPAPTSPPSGSCSVIEGGSYGICQRDTNDTGAGSGGGHCNALCKSGWGFPESDPDVECNPVQCSCTNSIRCCRKKTLPGQPTPTNSPNNPPGNPPAAPPPTATPIPPSPTPVPPTAVVTAPPAQDLSQKAGTPSKPTQAWMCLDTEFCYKSANCSKIAGVDYVHRVRLKNKADVKLQSSTRTYIFECLQTDVGYRCTSGNSAVDNEVIGTNYLDTMLSEHGYSFIKLTAADGSTSVGQPLTTGAGGELGPYEWESTTINNMGRVFFAVQNIVGSDALDAEGSLHQGTVTFEGKGGQKCLLIKYDPHGIVIDQTTKQLITNASVTLLQKTKQGNFIPVTSKDLIGGIINPTLTDNKGTFAFMVPGDIYQIKVEKSGYRPYLSPEITQKDKSEYLEVTLQRLSLIEKITQFILSGTSHP